MTYAGVRIVDVLYYTGESETHILENSPKYTLCGGVIKNKAKLKKTFIAGVDTFCKRCLKNREDRILESSKDI